MDKETEALIEQMTVEEKIAMLSGADMWHTVAIEHLGMPAIRVTDGPSGVRGTQSHQGPTSACFPAGIALAGTWNTELVGRVGAALAEETRAKGAHVLLAPTVNIHRSPLAGRSFECCSEDSYLTGRMAIAYINGLQSRAVGACIKHLACNDSEFQRKTISSQVPERALHEIHLRPFQMAIHQAKPWTMMSAYDKVNGRWCSELPRSLLRGNLLSTKKLLRIVIPLKNLGSLNRASSGCWLAVLTKAYGWRRVLHCCRIPSQRMHRYLSGFDKFE
jgi:beta-glucosidase